MVSPLPLNILLLTTSFNGLSQRIFTELREQGHHLAVELDIHDQVTTEAIDLFHPDLVIAPLLNRAIPETIWRRLPCLILHPGPPGDRGPAALDWAILDHHEQWGVTLLEANDELDGGDIWGSRHFSLRLASKASLYRHEVTTAAVEVILESVERFRRGTHRPHPQQRTTTDSLLPLRPAPSPRQRTIDWQRDSREQILRTIHSADSRPGVTDTLFDRTFKLYDAHPESRRFDDPPGSIVGHNGSAICRVCGDGHGLWIGHLLETNGPHPFKLPATQLLATECRSLPRLEGDYHEIRYHQQQGVGILYFSFYNGAMSTARCRDLLQALRAAKAERPGVLLLVGGPDFWSNGMDLNTIEAASSPADASQENIEALDDLALEIIDSPDHWVISLLRGNAAAGGLFLARAADQVWARQGVVLNPHYKEMGNLHGSEYWSYLLPRYCGEENSARISRTCLPMGVAEAIRLGLVDRALDVIASEIVAHAIEQAQPLTQPRKLAQRLRQKRQRRARDEAERPLQSYRQQELEAMRINFYGFDPSYHIARYNFVHKVPKSRTPLVLATHRRKGG